MAKKGKSDKEQRVKDNAADSSFEIKLKKKGKEEKDGKDDVYPFFEKYNDDSYIDFHDWRSNATAEEEGRKYNLINDLRQEVIRYHIDEGIIKSNDDLKCDYGFYTKGKILILVELKGGHFNHAVLQILNTIKLLGLDGHNLTKKLYARIVVSSARNVPGDSSKYMHKDLMKLEGILRKNNGQLKTGEKKYEEKLSTL